MNGDDRHLPIEAARVRAELTVQDLWLRYVALTGSGDAFDIDGYLQGLVPLESFQQDVLAQAVNEGLEDVLRSARVPLFSTTQDGPARDFLERLAGLLVEQPDHSASGEETGSPDGGPDGESPPS